MRNLLRRVLLLHTTCWKLPTWLIYKQGPGVPAARVGIHGVVRGVGNDCEASAAAAMRWLWQSAAREACLLGRERGREGE